jgi:polyisoprenoid-binding protein YceI
MTAVDTGSWAIQDGTLSITIQQIGAQVTGNFGSWQASINYDPDTGTGQVSAVIDTTSLTLGSVTDQAKGLEFFNVSTHSQATFEGQIAQQNGPAHTATGSLTLVGQTVPVTLNFDLVIINGVATVSGITAVDRRDFGMGAAYPDESSVGFSVGVEIKLTARQPE